MVLETNGTNSSARRRKTTRGSSAPPVAWRWMMAAGISMWRGRMAAAKRACFDRTCRRTAAGVTFSSAAMSARVVASKPFVAKTRRAVSRSCSRVMVGGRPISK